MRHFNAFKEALRESILVRVGRRERYYIMAFKGNVDKWYRGDSVTLDSYANRSKESDRIVDADVLVYDPSSESLDWKCLYRNTKGVYFKKGKAIYLNDAYSPEKSKRIFILEDAIEDRKKWIKESPDRDPRDAFEINGWKEDLENFKAALEKEYAK